MNEKELNFEQEKLDDSIKTIEELLEDEKKDLKQLFKDFMGESDELWKIAERKKIYINILNSSCDKPYFARIDFKSSGDNKNNSIYIGKNGIMKNSDIIVTDWRAPISSLYYDAEIGECSFNAPSGIVKGNMSLKRQFEIENGKISEYFDVDIVSQDKLLQKYLNSNNDARLKSIVSTIQKEQNDVIRRNISENIIVQGVAGSGKTTVALHRIAYLVYNYMNSINQNQYLVIGPNPVFLKYIESVLPELDVDGVEQCTFENFSKDYIGEDINVNSSDKKVNNSILGKNKLDIDKFKCSMKYKEMIEKFMDLYFLSITSKPLMLGDFEVLSSDIVTRVFQNNANGSFPNLNIRIENTVNRLCNYIENNKKDILKNYFNYSCELFETANSIEEKKKMRSMFVKDKDEISKNCRSLIRKYFNRSKIDAIKLYKLFINSISDFDLFNYSYINELKKETLKNIKEKSFDFEDLAALVYIKLLIDPNKDYQRINHVVIDEAQDLGEFNFFVIKNVLSNSSFSIFGDLAQSIYDYRSINNWEKVNDLMFNNNGSIINFNKSYRTTAEIMDVADNIAESIGLNSSDLVVRHGNFVEFSGVNEEDDVAKCIAQKILEYKNKGYKTIAVISKTDMMSNNINNKLSKLGINIPNVSVNDDPNDEKFRICTISNQLAKGLEFDAVIINDANEKVYDSDNALDMKLLYVAVTRALHDLDIVYSGNLTKTLDDYTKCNNDNKSFDRCRK